MSTGSALLLRRIPVLVTAVALLAALLPQSSARAQVADWVDIPVSLSLADASSYFVVVSSEDGTIEALQGSTTLSFGYPAAAACDGRTGDCFTSLVAGDGNIGFQGTGSQVRAALASLRFRVAAGGTLSAAQINVNVSLDPAIPGRTIFFNPANKHYYEVVSQATAITWTDALAAAAAKRLELPGGPAGGYEGYLATITDASESVFTTTYVNASNVWIGASDEVSVINAATGTTTYANQALAEGNWYWVTGPEAGTHFWEPGGTPASQEKGSGGVSVAGRFEAWSSGEPNGSGSGATQEHYAALNYDCMLPCSASANWNDFNNNGGTFGVLSYLVEFGPFPSDVLSTLETDVDLRVVDLIPVAAPVSTLAMSCSPDPVVAGGTVTCEVTGGDPNIDILWRASIDGVIASQGVRLDANGNGTFTFVAPAGSSGRSIAVELVEWNVGTAVGVTGRVLPSAIRAGGGPLDSPAALLLGSGLLLGALLSSRLRVRSPSEG